MSPIVCRSVQDAILHAKNHEEKIRDFYLHCRGRAKIPGVRTFFAEMADEAAAHLKLLDETEENEKTRMVPPDIDDFQLSDFMVDVAFTPEITYQEALVMAMKTEEKVHDFYQFWETRCGCKRISGLFAHLAAEALKHKKKLEAIYDTEILQWD